VMSRVRFNWLVGSSSIHDPVPPSREYFQRSYRTRAGKMDVSELQRILIYVHIPFCEQKCGYCNFAVEPIRTRKAYSIR